MSDEPAKKYPKIESKNSEIDWVKLEKTLTEKITEQVVVLVEKQMDALDKNKKIFVIASYNHEIDGMSKYQKYYKLPKYLPQNLPKELDFLNGLVPKFGQTEAVDFAKFKNEGDIQLGLQEFYVPAVIYRGPVFQENAANKSKLQFDEWMTGIGCCVCPCLSGNISVFNVIVPISE